MRISNYFNTNPVDIENHRFNVVIGVSLGNKYFSNKTIEDYLRWSLEYTKEKVAVLTPDKIHAINYEVRINYRKERAERVALRTGQKVRTTIETILSNLPSKQQDKVRILHWQEIESREYLEKVEVLKSEFMESKGFREVIINIVKESIPSDRFSGEDYKKLAEYPLEELPLLVCGLYHNNSLFTLLPYPGLSQIDYLARDLQNGDKYPTLSKKLDPKNKLHIVEAYAD